MSSPVQKRPNFTFIWALSVYVVLGQPAVPAQYLKYLKDRQQWAQRDLR